MTAIRTNRINGSSGAIAIALAVGTSPYIEVLDFDFVNGFTANNSPSAPSFVSNSTHVAVGSGNGAVLGTGRLNSNIHTWSYNPVSNAFGSAVQTSFTNPFSLNFSQNRDRLLVSGDDGLSEYAYDPDTEAIGAEAYNVPWTPFGAAFRISEFLWDDKIVIVSFTSGSSFVTYTRDLSTETLTKKQQSADFGVPSTFSLSGKTLADGRRTLALPTNGGFALIRMSSTGAIGSTINTSFTGSTVRTAMFDPYGRLITVETNSHVLNIYTQASSGAFARIDSVSDWGSKGTPGGMAYDKDRDVLFIGHTSSPYISAWKMDGTGFGSEYASPTGGEIPAGTVNRISVLYDERWKSFNT